VEIITTQAQGKLPVTIFRVSGDLDGSTYRDLIARGEEAVQTGARALLIDLAEIGFISSAGMVALHVLAKMLNGTPSGDFESGWEAFRDMDRQRSLGRQKAVKLLDPQPKVREVLEMTGFIEFFDVFTDEAEAVASF